MPKRKRASGQMSFDDKPAGVRRRGHRKRKYRTGKPAARRKRTRVLGARKKRTCTTVHVKAHTRKCPPATRKRATRKRSSSKRSVSRHKTTRRRTPRRNKKGRFVKS